MSTVSSPSSQQSERRDDAARFRAAAASRYADECAALDDILEQNRSLESRDLVLTAGQRLICEEIAERELGTRSIHAIAKILRRRRSEVRLRDEVGDPSVLCLAEADLAETLRRERETVAAIDDIAVGDGADEVPALSKQIGALQAKLSGLTAVREQAAARVASIRSRLDRLRRMAPEWLQADVARDVAAVQRTSSSWAEFVRCKGLLRQHKQLQWRMAPEAHQPSESDVSIANYAKAHCQDTIVEDQRQGRPWARHRVDLHKLRQYIERDLPAILADLESRRSAAAAEWQRLRAEVERPLEAFVRDGIV